MKLKSVVLAVSLFIFLLPGCSNQPAAPGELEPGVLSPCQVNASLIDDVIKVRGKALLVVLNPGGLGGVYLKLGEGDCEVGVRVQEDVWQTFSEDEKAGYKEGDYITAEGILFPAGKYLVVIHGKFERSRANMFPGDMP